MYTDYVPSFLRNPFQSSLSSLINELTPSAKDLSIVQSAITETQRLISQITPGSTPLRFHSTVLMTVGSRLRNTDITPLSHVDVFIVFEHPELSFHDTDLTLTIADGSSPLSALTDGSLHLITDKVREHVRLFFPKDATQTSQSKQAILLPFHQLQLEVRITPAFALSDFFLIPEEKSELKWRKVAPQKGKEFLDQLNTRHQNFLIPAIRLMKFWNRQKNNSTLRNYHIEASGYFIFEEIPTPIPDLISALQEYAKHLSKYMYTCPDPVGLAGPINQYLPDNVNQWYLYMNRIAELRDAIDNGEKALVDFLKKQDQ